MKVEIAMLRSEHWESEVVCVARVISRDRCPILKWPLHQAVRRLVAGMPVVLLNVREAGDIETYGEPRHTLEAATQHQDVQLWAEFHI